MSHKVLDWIAQMIVLQSLLTPPPSPKYEIYRKAVSGFVRWLQSQSSAIVGVLAPAGYGKTSCLRQLHLEAKAAGQSVAWLSLRGIEPEANALLLHIGEALRVAGVEFEPATDCALSPLQAIVGILSAIERSGKRVTLFLDDVDLLEPQLASIVERLFSTELDNLCIAFSARRMPSIRLGKIVTSGRYQPIPQSDLLLNFADMHELFRKRLVDVPDVFLLGSQYRITQGWPALAQVLSRTQSSRFSKPGRSPMVSANGDVVAFFNEEVLADCSDAELRLLRLIALVGAIDAEQLAKMFSDMEAYPRVDSIIVANPVFERSLGGSEITINPLLVD